MRHVGEFLVAEIVHEAFPHHVVEVIEHTLLLLSSEGSHHLAPLLQVVDVAHVGESHQHDKHIEMLAILIAGIKFLQGCIPIAMGDARDAMRHIWLQGSALDKCLLQALVVYLLEVDALGTASDGLQEEFRFLAHHDEEGLRRRFLQEF